MKRSTGLSPRPFHKQGSGARNPASLLKGAWVKTSGEKLPEVLVIIGPTASGKTALALTLAERNNAAVISADSRQVFAELNIGTAKPAEAWRDVPHPEAEPDLIQSIPHYLLNVSALTTTYSLAQWHHAATKLLDKLTGAGQRVIVVGGTMLYVDSLLKNFVLPPAQPNRTLRAQLELENTDTLYARLIERDPGAGSFIEPHHKRRIIRALEVIEATGRPFSELRSKNEPRYHYRVIGLFPGWQTLKTNIETRATEMLQAGLTKEAADLVSRYGEDLPLLKTLNYAEALQLLRGTMSEQQALEIMVARNLRYAHRQMSWWKNNKTINWYEASTDALK